MELVHPRDLAFYVTLCSLHSLNRTELKGLILSAAGFKTLMEGASEIGVSDVIENFLNGRYMDYQRQMATIASAMKYDLYFGHRLPKLMKDIRKKALIQYVLPYKVIDMREIAKAFDMNLE